MTTADQENAPEPRHATCGSSRCRMPILFAMSATSGKWVVLSKATRAVVQVGATPPKGAMIITDQNLARAATEMDYGRDYFLSHWADCKDRQHFVRQKKSRNR